MQPPTDLLIIKFYDTGTHHLSSRHIYTHLLNTYVYVTKASLFESYLFVPFAVETLESRSCITKKFIRDISRYLLLISNTELVNFLRNESNHLFNAEMKPEFLAPFHASNTFNKLAINFLVTFQ